MSRDLAQSPAAKMPGIAVSPRLSVGMPRAASRPSACQLRGRAHAHRHHQYVEGHLPAALHGGLAGGQLHRAVPQQEGHVLLLNMLLHQGGGFLVQDGGKNLIRQIRHGHAGAQVADALQALQADQARAHNQHPAVGGQIGPKLPRILEGHEGVVLHRIDTLDGRHKWPGAGGQQQAVVGHNAAVGAGNSPGVLVDGGDLHPPAEFHPVVLI